jgi:two-component system chemotaxis response regulator CheB
MRIEAVMSPIRVLIVDDSAIVRRLLSEALASSTEVNVVGTASNGSIALEKIPQLNPDVITLDIEMPGMDGLQTLTEIRKFHPKLPVIMFSTLTERGAAKTLEALALGASDYATKPSNSESLAAAKEHVLKELVAKVVSLGHAARSRPTLPPLPPTLVKPRERRAIFRRIDVLTIGTSTGGPNALAEVIPCLPADLQVPVVLVQHMPPLFTRLLADRLNQRSAIRVDEGRAGEKLEPGCVWIAPGDFHMTIARQGASVVLALNQDPREHSCRPAVDVLFRSVAQVYGPGVLAVVMTGMGADGAEGARCIRAAGGEVLVQDEATSVVWGMPGAVAATGQADQILPLAELGPAIVRRVAASHLLSSGQAAARL